MDSSDTGRKRKYVYGKTREKVHEKWIRLHTEARKGTVIARHRNLDTFLAYWLESIVRPS